MDHRISTVLGKTTQQMMQRLSNNGQALPGLIVEKIHPTYLATMLQQLPEGIVFITGTNGKTTTAKIVTELLQAEGKRVLTNATGSNLTRGIISGILQHITWKGELPFDIAIFEVDEAYANKLITQIQPRWVLALNVSRDQLDRFGEVDAVAQLLGNTMSAATNGVVTNADDPYLSTIGARISASELPIEYFGVSPSLQKYFPHEKMTSSVAASVGSSVASSGNSTAANIQKKPGGPSPRVELTSFEGQDVTYTIDGKPYTIRLNITGQHNFQNAAAALALVLRLLPGTPVLVHLANLSRVAPAYGRGEFFTLKNGSTVQLALVKNPTSFFQALASYRTGDSDIMIAINDNYADSRDVSWLWDVDFSSLKGKRGIITSGTRAADMALRLQYDDVQTEKVIPNLDAALHAFPITEKRKVIFATYTAMLHLYATLKKQAASTL